MTSSWEAARVIAGITRRRLVRGRSIWVSGVLVVLPVAYAAATAVSFESGVERWQTTVHVSLRLNILLAAGLSLAPAVGEEVQAHTYTWLWSRPIERSMLLLGKALAVVPLLLAGFIVSFSIAYLIATGPEAGQHLGLLFRALAAMAASLVAASATALGIGTFMRGHGLVAVLAFVLAAEQLLSFMPGIGNLSITHHAYGISGAVPASVPVETPLTSALWLLGMTIVWSAIAVWRIDRAELGTADS